MGRSSTSRSLKGRVVVFAYPRTGEPGKTVAGRRLGHDPRRARLHAANLLVPRSVQGVAAAGADHVFGLSTQDHAYQREMAERLHLPFTVLSDEKLALTRALTLPTMQVAGLTLIKRLALIIDDARIAHVLYPVFPPDRNAARRAGVAEGQSTLIMPR